MKKTLFALLALSGLAMGEFTGLDANKLTVIDAKIGGNDSITSGNAAIGWNNYSGALDSYILTFSFGKLPTSGHDPWIRLNYDNNNQYGIKSDTASTMVLYATDWSVPISDALTVNTTNTFALTRSSDAVYFSNLDTGDYVSITIDTSVNNQWKLGNYSRIYTNSATVNVTVGEVASLAGLTAAQVQQVAITGTYTDTPAVPEPATATLSLLALAGLAARRRRK